MDNLDMNRIPEHIAIIMDGNGRWATERGKNRSYGHQAGVDAVRCITSECTRLGVKFLTLYTFSTENWNRPADEISALMGLVLSSLEDEIFMKNNVRFQVIGDMKRLPQAVQDKLQETMDHTAKNDAMTMVVALSYSSRWEIMKAMKETVKEAMEKGTSYEEVEKMLTEENFEKHLETNFMPDPDLLIRTVASCVSATICCGRLHIQSCISAILTGQTSTRSACTRLLRVTRLASVALARLRLR